MLNLFLVNSGEAVPSGESQVGEATALDTSMLDIVYHNIVTLIKIPVTILPHNYTDHSHQSISFPLLYVSPFIVPIFLSCAQYSLIMFPLTV